MDGKPNLPLHSGSRDSPVHNVTDTETTPLPPLDEITLIDLVVVLAENARLLIIGPLLVGLAALGISFLLPPTFTARTTLLPPQQQQSTAAILASQLGALAGLAGSAGLNLKNPADLYVAIIKSRTIADNLVDRFELTRVYDVELRQDAREELASATKVISGRDGLITVEVDDHDPKRAADIANAYVQELTRLNDNFAVTEAQQRRAFFERQLKVAQQNLVKAQLALGGAGVPESLIKASPEAMMQEIAMLKAQVTAQEVQLSTMRGRLTEQSPEYQMAQRQLASLRAQLKQAERDQPVEGTQRPEYLNRFRDFKYFETLFELMAKQYELARLDEAREGAIIQVVDRAVVPEWKSKPRKALIAVLTVVASGVLLMLGLFLRAAVRSVRDAPESATKYARIAAGIRELMRFARK